MVEGAAVDTHLPHADPAIADGRLAFGGVVEVVINRTCDQPGLFGTIPQIGEYIRDTENVFGAHHRHAHTHGFRRGEADTGPEGCLPVENPQQSMGIHITVLQAVGRQG